MRTQRHPVSFLQKMQGRSLDPRDRRGQLDRGDRREDRLDRLDRRVQAQRVPLDRLDLREQLARESRDLRVPHLRFQDPRGQREQPDLGVRLEIQGFREIRDQLDPRDPREQEQLDPRVRHLRFRVQLDRRVLQDRCPSQLEA